MELFIQITQDPHANRRGFTILGRKMRISGAPTIDTMKGIDGKDMVGKFWVVEHADFIRAVPEWSNYSNQRWLIPVEFATIVF